MAKESVFSKLFFGLRARLSGGSREPGIPNGESPLGLLFFIVDRNKASIITDIFVQEKARFHSIIQCRGTASSEILDLLGIGANAKAMITCLEQTSVIPVLMKEARRKLGLYSPGAGIAFTVPLSAINDPVLLIFRQSAVTGENTAAGAEPDTAGGAPAEGGGGKMPDDHSGEKFTNDLIISFVNKGYSDELMNTAREAGASGGTVIGARGQAHEGAVKFFGVSVQDEKEIVLILTSREKKVPIMRAISEAHGLNSKAQGIVLSLPVDNVMGLSLE